MSVEFTGAERIVIQEAANYLRQGWTSEAYALDQDGNPVSWRSEDAVAWDMAGALNKALAYFGASFTDEDVILKLETILRDEAGDDVWIDRHNEALGGGEAAASFLEDAIADH